MNRHLQRTHVRRMYAARRHGSVPVTSCAWRRLSNRKRSDEVQMSASLPIRVVLAGIALCVAPAISRAQAPQTRACKDGTISSHSHFACWGHGGVDTTRAVEGGRATSSKHRPMEPIQAGAPRSKHAKAATRSESKASVHHERAEHHDRHAL